MAALAVLLALGVMRFGVCVLDWGDGGRVCPSIVETGVPCMGCGGTRALDRALRGDFRQAAVVNPLGAFAGLATWTLFFAGLSSLVTGWPHFLRWFLVVFGLAAPVVFLAGAVTWWWTWSSVLTRGA